MKCFVPSCKNHTHQGRFNGEVCRSCLSYANHYKSCDSLGEFIGLSTECVEFIKANTEEVIKRGS